MRAGRFVNGDWYVVGPVSVVDIEPRPLWGDAVGPRINQGSVREDAYPGRQARNGSVLNPPVTGRGGGYNRGGYDSRLPSDRYDPALFAHLPIEMKPGDTLVSTISRPDDQITSFSGQHVQPLQVAATLTCMADPLPPDAFRPSYTDTANSPVFLARILRAERVWNHDAFFAYVDRWMTEDDSRQVEAMKAAGVRDMTGSPFGVWPRQGAISGTGCDWVRTLWNAYRNQLPPPPPGMDTPPTPKADETWKY